MEAAGDPRRPSHDDIALPAMSQVQSDRPLAFINASRLEGGLAGHASATMQHKAMLVCGKTFEALLQDLQEKAVLKSSKQLSEAIQHLCFFDADPALLQTMVNLIVHGNIQSGDREGRVVLRLAHYFASSLPPPSTLANMQTKVVAKQVAHKQLNRRLIALRTLSVAASDSDVVRTRRNPHRSLISTDISEREVACLCVSAHGRPEAHPERAVRFYSLLPCVSLLFTSHLPRLPCFSPAFP